MTRMTPTDDRDDLEQPRSILSAMWFRVVLVMVVLGVIAVLAVPHVLDMVNAPPVRQSASVKLAPGLTPSMPSPESSSSPPAPAAEPPVAPQAVAATGSTAPQPTEKPKAMQEAAAPPPSSLEPAPAVAKVPDAKGVGRASRGAYWVQVGAFRDAGTAQRLAARLRSENYSVAESVKRTPSGPRSAPASEAGDRYNVFVSGMAPNELTAKLSAKGLNVDAVAGGVMVKPSLSLREAVALSRDLSTEGLQVQVRRAGRGEATVGASAGGEAYHRVRVGSFPDRAAALAAAKELESKGYKTFVARGKQ
jgi:cell division septation protein DedD